MPHSLTEPQVKIFEDYILAAVDGGAVAKGQNTRYMLAGAIKMLQIGNIEVPAHWEFMMLGSKEVYTAIQERRAPVQAQSNAE